MTRFSNCLALSLLAASAAALAGPVVAGDAAEFRSHGFSDDERGRYFAFEEFGVESGPHYPYSNIYIVDLATDKWVPDTPVRVRLEEEGETPIVARVKAFEQATPIMQQYQISNSGVVLAASPVSEVGEKAIMRFQKTSQPLLGNSASPYTLEIDTKDVRDLNGCEMGGGTVTGFALTLTTPTGETRQLHDETSAPRSRGCPLDYHLSAVFAPTRMEAQTHAVALVGVFTQTDDGQDLRYIAVPFSFLIDPQGNESHAMLSKDELERYARHILLRDVGGPGQQKLKAAKVLVVGAGGLGSPLLAYLAAAGVGTLGIVDDDTVALSNLQRQIIHDSEAVGTLKVESAETSLARINPHVMVQPHAMRLDEANGKALLQSYDLVVDGTDNFDTRYLVAELCEEACKPLITGAVGMFDGSITTLKPYETDAQGRLNPRYQDLFPNRPAPGSIPACAEAGILGALTGVIGSMMALEIIKEIVGLGEGLVGRLILYDARASRFETIRYRRRKE